MYNIPVGFHFQVIVSGFSAENETRFQEAGGFSSDINTEEFREGGLNQYPHKLPTGGKYPNLTLKRGMMKDSELAKWCRDAMENFIFDPRDVTVKLLNEDHEPLVSWEFQQAFPVKWSISDFKAQENAIVIESLELSYQMFRKI